MARRIAITLLISLLAATASAQEEDPKLAEARAAFEAGTEHVVKAQWADALVAFERAAKLRPHAVTSFNIAACERAMGRYARAQRTFERALIENDAAGGTQLADSVKAEIKGYIQELAGILVRVRVTLIPTDARIAIDGRPLAVTKTPQGFVGIAGVRDSGPGERAPAKGFVLVLDPGLHVLTLSRKGFEDSIVRRTFRRSDSATLRLELDRLPAILRIQSNEKGAIASVDGRDVGPTPVEVLRPAGRHRVSVAKEGFDDFETRVTVRSGEQALVRAPLEPREPTIWERWWFWTTAGVVVTGTVLASYFLTRPEPERQEIDGGTLGWKVSVP